jgi:hypothetical protein
MKMGED